MTNEKTATVTYVDSLIPARTYMSAAGLTIRETYDCDSHAWIAEVVR